MRAVRLLVMLSAATALLLSGGACVPDNFSSGARPGMVNRAGVTLAEGLARGYRMLSEYEGYVRSDSATAAYYAQKADAAAGGDLIEPDKVTPASLTEVKEARDTLMDARDVLGRGVNAARIAEAQVNFDCWVGRASRKDESAQACKERFFAALNGLDLKGRRYTVYFASGQEVPDEVAFSVIRRAAAAFVDRDSWRIHLTGYSDSKGDKSSNLMLSMRRALAVRNALAQNGVDLGKIVIEAAGTDKAASEANARRVEIAIVPAYLDHKGGKGPDIRAIAPQYFGEEEPDL